jgi:tRNA pseudouridine55 synthase
VTDGFVLVDKPAGRTSHQVVGRLRRLLGTKKIGHAGTLDPLATGLLVCGVGRATRLLGDLMGETKVYRARLRFGAETSTEDADGEVTAVRDASGLTRAALVAAGEGFVGAIDQVPSAVSAIKVDGRRAYARVRAGEDVVLAPRRVTIEALEWGPLGDPERGAGSVLGDDRSFAALRMTGAETLRMTRDITLTVTCSAGTYIRALARDLGRAVGTGAHLTALRRLQSGSFSVDEAVTLADDPPPVLPITAVMARVLPVFTADADQARRIGFGQPLDLDLAGPTLMVDAAGRALAVYAPAVPGGGRPRPAAGAVPRTVLTGGG